MIEGQSQRFNELWGPQKSVSDARMDRQTDSRYYQVLPDTPGDNYGIGLLE